MKQHMLTASYIRTAKTNVFAVLFALLFAASQVLCCFHTHDPSEESLSGLAQQIDCEICLVASMPVDVGGGDDAASVVFSTAGASLFLVASSRHGFSAAPDSARAPPKV